MNIPLHWVPWKAKARILSLEDLSREKDNRISKLLDELRGQNIEIEQLQTQIKFHDEVVKNHAGMSERRKRGIEALLSWIQAAHRIDVPKSGTILEHLQEIQKDELKP